MTIALRTLAVLLLTVMAAGAHAHELRPAYLELRQIADERFDIHWRTPARGDLRLGLTAELPANCDAVLPVSRQLIGAAYSERWTADCRAGLAGQTIGIGGLAATLTDVLVRIEWLDGTESITRLTPSSPTFVVAASPGFAETASTYLKLGVEHILSGFDHLLFVLALLMLVRGWRRLIVTITAFTIAHSLTLAAATLGLISLPPPPVEAAIALSIVFVAAEILRRRRDTSGLADRWPWLIAFIFGLLHGFGFAGALSGIGLPENAVAAALFFFNVGVELGQLAFIAAVWAVFATMRWLLSRAGRGESELASASLRAEAAAAYGIGAVAAFWTIERVQGFWT